MSAAHLALLLAALLLVACGREQGGTLGVSRPPDESLRAGCAAARARQIGPFQAALAEGIRAYPLLCQRVGVPDRETGSGLRILIYELDDGSELWLGYAGLNDLSYARWQQAEGQVVDLLAVE